MHADQRGLQRLGPVATIANGPTGAATTSPIRGASGLAIGPNQPAAIASSLGSTQARSPRTSAQAAATSAAAPGCGVHVPGPWLATEQRHSVAQRGQQVHVDPVVGPHVDHAVVGGHVQRGTGGQRRGELLGQLVHVAQVVAPGVGGSPEGVPGPVELAVVDGDQRTVGIPQRLRAWATRAPMLSAGRYSVPRMTATDRPVRSSADAADPVGATPAPAARSYTVVPGCQVRGSTELSHRRPLSSLFLPGMATW